MRLTAFFPSAARAKGDRDSIIGRAMATPPARRKFRRVNEVLMRMCGSGVSRLRFYCVFVLKHTENCMSNMKNRRSAIFLGQERCLIMTFSFQRPCEGFTNILDHERTADHNLMHPGNARASFWQSSPFDYVQHHKPSLHPDCSIKLWSFIRSGRPNLSGRSSYRGRDGFL